MFRIDFNKLRFLLCDDNPHMRRILRTLLHSFGAREVYEAEDGATALEMYTHYVPDIVITDWSMPILAGPISAKGLYQRILNVVANPRPFIKTKTYFGPYRRRNTTAADIGPERRVGGDV